MPAALKRLEDAIAASYDKAKRKGKLKGVDKGAYVYGSQAVQNWRKVHGVKRGEK
jgi:hypothetical protein